MSRPEKASLPSGNLAIVLLVAALTLGAALTLVFRAQSALTASAQQLEGSLRRSDGASAAEIARAQAAFAQAESRARTQVAAAALLVLLEFVGTAVLLWRARCCAHRSSRDFQERLGRQADENRSQSAALHDEMEKLGGEKQRIEEREAALRSILANSPVMLWALDREGVFTLREGRALVDLGQKPGDGVGQHHSEVMQGYELFSEHVQRALSGESFSAETQYCGRWYSTRFDPLRAANGLIVGVAGFSTDITARRQAEQLAISEESAREATRLKSEFLASMSHELRTPMNGIVGMAGLLNQTPLTEAQRGMLNAIQTSADSLLVVVNDILDLSRLETGKLQLETTRFDPQKLLEDLLAAQGPRAHAKGLELIGDYDGTIPARLVGDEGRIRQVIASLLSNGIKFSTAGHVLARLRKTRQDGPRTALRLEVSDTGVGIAPEVQETLLKPFTARAGSTNRKVGAAGLGLAIAKQLVDLMGGTIGLTSELGRGSTFWIEWEFPADPEAPPAAPLPSLSGKRLLVVDDNEVSRGILALKLAGRGATVDTAPDSGTALDLCVSAAEQDRPYAALVVDRYMPGTDGLQFARKVRAARPAASTPIVLLSPDELPAEAAAARLVQATVPKPVRESGLLHGIALALGLEIAPAQAPASAPAPRAIPAPAPAAPGKLRILLAEDNSVNQRIGRMMLEKLGHQVDLANDGQEALDLFEANRYDAVLLDCQMPRVDGYEAARRIRLSPQPWSRIPVIAVTANVTAADRQLCLDSGMDDFLTKPLRIPDLQAALARCSPSAAESTQG